MVRPGGDFRVVLTNCMIKGTAIWVYFIFANNVTSVPGVVTGETDCRFGLDNDGAPFGYRHVPDPNAPDSFLYSQLVYFRDDLLYGPHRLEIFADGDTDTYINFDYAIYAYVPRYRNLCCCNMLKLLTEATMTLMFRSRSWLRRTQRQR